MDADVRLHSRSLAQATLVGILIIGCANEPGVDPGVSTLPTDVTCTDAPQLRQRAVEDRNRTAKMKSDQERIYTGNRANFFASLAIIADLECRTTLGGEDEALKLALASAREAAASSSMYERAFKWGEADSHASEAIALLIQQLPARPSR